MDCYYHPGRESVAACSICGKPVCAECFMEIGGKTYCKDCLEKIIGMNEPKVEETTAPSQSPISDTLQEMDSQPTNYEPPKTEPSYVENTASREEIIGDVLGNENTQQQTPNDSPYAVNIDDSQYGSQDYINPYSNENTYEQEPPIYQEPTNQYEDTQTQTTTEQYSTENTYNTQEPQYEQYKAPMQQSGVDDGYIYPDHSYQPPENKKSSIENKYESYLDDLYYDEPEVHLTQEIAKDEERYGSLTRNPYESNNVNAEQYQTAPSNEYDTYAPPRANYQNQGYIDIDNVQNNNPEGDYIPPVYPAPEQSIRRNRRPKQRKNGGIRASTRSIHNIENDEKEKEPYGAVDIILTIILVVLIIIVLFYIVYMFFLSSVYPTFLDAILGLKNPGVMFGHLMGK